MRLDTVRLILVLLVWTNRVITTTSQECCTEEIEQACEWPFFSNHDEYSIIACGDAYIASKNIFKAIAVGGELSRLPAESAVMNSLDVLPGVSYVGSFSSELTSNWFHGASSGGDQTFEFKGESPPVVGSSDFCDFFVFERYRYLANNLVESLTSYEGYNVGVFVFGDRGRSPPADNIYTIDIQTDSQPAQAYNNGTTLFVFDSTVTEVIIDRSNITGRAFGASILAPYATVTLLEGVGFVNGQIIAGDVVVEGSFDSVHDAHFTGELLCDEGMT